MKSEELLKIFKAKLKKYSTREIAKIFSSFDRYYFRNYQNNPLTKKFIIGYTTRELCILPWLFNEIIYYSTDNNDFKKSITENEAWELYLCYYKYFDKVVSEFTSSNFDKSTNNIATLIFYGHTQEQAIYYVPKYMFMNRFNRNYFLLKDKVFGTVDLSSIIAEKYNTDLLNFIQILSVISFFSIYNEHPLNSECFLDYISDKTAYLKVLDDLSVSYIDCRTDKSRNIKIFKIKPILHTSFDEYIVPSIFTMFYNIGDKVYWLLKDKLNKSDIFVHEFGKIFENFVFEILIKQYGKKNVERIPRVKGEKSADFIIKGKNFIFLFEVKSGVARAGAKQTNLNINDLDAYIENNIVDAMKQLDASAKRYIDNKTIICFIVNYDTIFTEDSIMFEISSKYEPTYYELNNLILFGVDNFEVFIYNYNNLEKLESVFSKHIKSEKLSAHMLVENCEIPQNYFYEDIFNKEIDKFIEKSKENKKLF